MEYFSTIKMEWSADTDKYEWTLKNHAKWRKPDIKGHVLYYSIYMKYLE